MTRRPFRRPPAAFRPADRAAFAEFLALARAGLQPNPAPVTNAEPGTENTEPNSASDAHDAAPPRKEDETQ